MPARGSGVRFLQETENVYIYIYSDTGILFQVKDLQRSHFIFNQRSRVNYRKTFNRISLFSSRSATSSERKMRSVNTCVHHSPKSESSHVTTCIVKIIYKIWLHRRPSNSLTHSTVRGRLRWNLRFCSCTRVH